MSQYDYVDNKAAVNETLHEIFVTEEEHFIANSRSTDIVKAIQVPAVNVHPKSDLQQWAEHISSFYDLSRQFRYKMDLLHFAIE